MLLILTLVLVSIVILSIIFIFPYMFPIKIGVIISTDTVLGSEENLALRFFKDEFQKLGNRKVEFIIENPHLEKEDIEEAFQRLEKERVCAIIGGSVSYSGKILSELAKDSKIPVLTLSVTTSLLDRKKDDLYRFMLSTSIRGKALSRFLEKNKIKNLVIVSSDFNEEFSATYVDSIEKNFEGNILKLRIGELETERKTEILNLLKDFNPDAFFLMLQSNDLIRFLLRFKGYFKDRMFISSLWALDMALMNLENDLLNGVIFPSEYEITGDFSKDPLIRELEKLYGFKFSLATFNTLSVMRILFSLLKEDGADSEKLIDSLNEPREYYLSNDEKIYLNEYGDAFKDWFYFIRYRDKNFYLVDKMNVKDLRE